MSSIVYGGSVVLKPEVEKEKIDPMLEEGYPFEMPKVLLEGCGEEYYPQVNFTWADDSVIVTRKNRIIKYTESDFTELLAENEKGDIVWIDGRSAPYSDCWDGKYLGERREATKYQVEVFDLNTSQKTTYDCTESKTGEFTEYDKYRLADYVGPEAIKEPFEIENNILKSYKGADSVVHIPEGITEISHGVFYNNKAIEKIIIPKSCVNISPNSICSLHPSVCIEIDKDNPRYCNVKGCLIDKQTSTLIRAAVGAEIPNDGSVIRIGEDAFREQADLVYVTIPDTVIEIGDDAFYHCENLESVCIPETVVEIGNHAFCYCRALRNIHLPDSLKMIGYGAFDGCRGLTSINLPDSIIQIGSRAFSDCEKLGNIELPTSISMIENHVFSGCKSLTDISIPESVTRICDGAFHGCTGLTEIKIPTSVVEIGDSAFGGCTNLVTIDLPDSIIEIGKYTFSGCKSLVGIKLPDSVSFIGHNVFYDCEALEEVYLSASLTTIPACAFQMCRKLARINLPEGITKIGNCAFYCCNSLTNISIPTSVKKISRNAFANTGLTALCIPKSVKMLGNGSFSNCRALRQIELPEAFEKDGMRVFGGKLVKKEDGESIIVEEEQLLPHNDYHGLPF